MKKRKELDALLLTNMNGKKLSKGFSSAKEGHELLRNEASWDSNSTENDEFFSPPRRLTIRKPHKWRLCATGVQLCMFVVMVACIVVTGGLVWMHLDLKQDLDELRLRIAKVESELETSSEQASTVSTLQLRIEQLQSLPVQISSINRQIAYLNLTSSQLQAKVKAARDEIKALPTSSIDGLQQSTAQIGSTMQGVQGLQSQHTDQITSLTSSLGNLQTSLTELQGDVTKLHLSAAVPTPVTGASHPTTATSAPTGILDVRKDIQSLQQGQGDVSRDVIRLNATVAAIQLWKQDLMPRLATMESTTGHDNDTSDGSWTQKLAQLQSQVNTLMGSAPGQLQGKESGGQTPNPTLSAIPVDWRQDMESKVQAIQKRIEELSPKDLNNNLLNANTTRGLQHQIERALEVFKEENLKSVDDQLAKLYRQHGDIADLQQEVEDLEGRVQDLENTGEVTSPRASPHVPLGDLSTLEPSTTVDDPQPITIEGISTESDLSMKFYVMDENGDNFLTYQELRDFLGPGAPPEDRLMEYDKDENGKLDLNEMRTALGFH